MRNSIMAAVMASVALAPIPAVAQQTPREARQEYRDEVRQAEREYRRDLRRADSRRDVREARRDYRDDVRDARRDYRDDRRDWRQYRNYDWNRPGPGQRAYYADDYYRDGRYYSERRLTRQDRIYAGRDGRYYCRRPDGTTGLIVGGIAGGFLGNALAGRGSGLLGTLLGAGGGAALGSSIDRGNVRCR